jgi:hypothetical protein
MEASSLLRPSAVLHPRKKSPVYFDYEVGWSPANPDGMVDREISTHAENRTAVVQPASSDTILTDLLASYSYGQDRNGSL